ncbi:MAG: acyl-CoA dehydrogenase family protein, partial [Myxococcales bacterium]|nr:acyl-CoA dehydrogenase family protein [Myxococcales bacterium]
MANFFTDNDDLRWYIERGIDWEPLVRATEAEFRNPDGPKSVTEALAFYKETLEMVGGFVADEIAPHGGELDRQGVRHQSGEALFPPRLAGIFDQVKQLGLHGLCVPRELGGMNAPVMLYFLASELFGRADVSVMAHHGFHGGMAMAMLLFSVREGTTKIDPERGTILETRFRAFIEEIVRGDAWGCMDITEPDAGSDMARLRAKGEQDADGAWYVTGQKIFITSGHGKYHFVIARTEAVPVNRDANDFASGLDGLSMFLVPAYEEGANGRKRIVGLGRIEVKLGHHASVTAQLDFDRAPAFLVGERGQGFEYMLLLMNNARLGVGFECLGLQEAAHRLASGYAAERKSMGKTLDKHEMIADYLDEMRTDAQALRALCVHGAFHEELAQKKLLVVKYAAMPDADKKKLEREIVHHKREARRVTPLLKYFGAEKAVESARRCVQIHGGVGYTKDFGAEKLLRDAVVMPIYEGTSQIQALMAMKDTLGGILKNPQRFVRRGAQARWRSLSSRDGLERAVARIQTLSFAAQQHLILRTAGDKLKATAQKPLGEWPRQLMRNWNPKRDFAYAMLHAERLTRLLVDEFVSELLLAQAKKDPARRELAERWLERAEPRCRHLVDEITSTGD